jgi:hypothetical protein
MNGFERMVLKGCGFQPHRLRAKKTAGFSPCGEYETVSSLGEESV